MTDHGPFTHHMSNDGCSLVIEEFRTDGIYTTTLDWPTRRDAQDNVERALASYAKRSIGDTLNEPGQTRKDHRFGRVFLTVVGGPPTWWVPRIKVRRGDYPSIMIGWLRRGFAFSVSVGKR